MSDSRKASKLIEMPLYGRTDQGSTKAVYSDAIHRSFAARNIVHHLERQMANGDCIWMRHRIVCRKDEFNKDRLFGSCRRIDINISTSSLTRLALASHVWKQWYTVLRRERTDKSGSMSCVARTRINVNMKPSSAPKGGVWTPKNQEPIPMV